MRGLTLQIDDKLYRDIHRCKLKYDMSSMTVLAEHAIRFLESCQFTERINKNKYKEHLSVLKERINDGKKKSITVYMKQEFYNKLRKIHSLYMSAYLKDTLMIAFYVYLLENLPRPINKVSE